jgi:hypothetical protein
MLALIDKYSLVILLPQPQAGLLIFETIFLGTYVVEALTKWLGSGSKLYFHSLANRFDLFIIVTSIIGCAAAGHRGAWTRVSLCWPILRHVTLNHTVVLARFVATFYAGEVERLLGIELKGVR